MIKKITRDPMFLTQKSENATEVDAQVVTDLLDTLRAGFGKILLQWQQARFNLP